MQDNNRDKNKKKIICNALAKVVKKLRGEKSQFIFASENDISTSIISTIERGMKDPQLTTIYKLAEAFGMDIADFLKLVNDELPKKFSLIEK